MKSLSRKKAHRHSMLRNLVTSFILYERMETTSAKAKETKSIVERLIALAKKNNLPAKRRLLSYILDKNAVRKVFEVYVPRYKNQKTGIIKLYKKGPRLGDAAEISILEFKKVKEIETKKEENGQKADRKTTKSKEARQKPSRKERTS